MKTVVRCRCGHVREAHRHYRPGSDCAHCAGACARYRPLIDVRGARARLGRLFRR